MPTSIPPPQQRTTFHHLYWDVFWFGVLQGSAITFLAVYAARIGASALQVGLLTSGPAIINLALSLPAGRWLERRPITIATFRSSLLHRLGYLMLIPLPWLLPEASQAWALPVIIALMSIPGTLLAIAFNAMFADVVAPEWRAHVVGRRNALLAVSSSLTSVLCGQLLDRVAYPANYQLVFAVGALGAAMSSYYLGRLRPLGTTPPRMGQPLLDFARPGALTRVGDALRGAVGLRFLTRGGARTLLRLDLLRGPFGLMMLAYLAFYAFQYVSIPVQPVFWVREIHLTGGEISLGNAIFYAMMLLASMGLGRITQRLGHRNVMVIGALFYGLYPFLNGLAQDATLYYIASVINGLVWGMASGGLVNRLMERVPEDDRPAHMALHNLALNLGILAGSLLGPAFADTLGLRNTLLISGGLRLLGAVLLALWA